MQIKKYVTVKDMTEFYPVFSVGALRHLIHENSANIKSCMVRVGGRVLFDLERFQSWIDAQRMSKDEK